MAKEKNVRRQRRSKRFREILLLRINIALAVAIIIVCVGIAIKEIQNRKEISAGEIVVPDWIEQDFLMVNRHSRPGVEMTKVNDIVIHYTANPGTSARANWNFFNNQAFEEKPDNPSSSHFIIDQDGSILQCVPLGEIAHANSPRNYDTISIECCHNDETGVFTEATKASLLRLAGWLCEELDLSEKHVLRHYDVSTWKKPCPKYYVDHEDEWVELQKEIQRYRK